MQAAERTTERRLLITTAILLWGLATHSTYAGQGDEPHYLAITHSLAFDRDLDLSNNYGAGELIVDGIDPGLHVAAGPDGITRPVHDIGLPLLFAPYVAVVHPLVQSLVAHLPRSLSERARLTPSTVYRHGLSAAMIAITLLVVHELFGILLAIGVRSGPAFWVCLLVVLSPPLSIYSMLFFTEVLSALLALAIFRRIVVDEPRAAWTWAIAGGLAGLLLLVHVRNAGLVIALVSLAAYQSYRRGAIACGAAFMGGALVAAGVRAGVTYYLWHSFLTTPHATPGEWQTAADTGAIVLRRLAGLLVDQEYGLLPYAPVFVVIAFAIARWPRELRDVRGSLALVIASYLVLVLLPQTNVHGWTGGWSPAGRFWVPVIPFLAIGVAIGMTRAPRTAVIALVALQVILSAYFWQNPKNLWNDGDGVATVCERGGATFCGALPSLVQPSDAVGPETP